MQVRLKLWYDPEIHEKPYKENPLVPYYTPDGLCAFSPLVRFQGSVKLWIFDADGTIRRATNGQVCPNEPGEWELIPEAVEFCRLIKWEDNEQIHSQIALVSNQGGVSLGYLSEEIAAKMVADTAESLHDAIGDSGYGFKRFFYRICPSNDKEHPYRKPNPGMLQAAMAWANVTPDQTVMVGDMTSDRDAARNAGVKFCWAQEILGI